MQETEKERLRILLADDHPMFCEGLLSILQSEEGLEVIGQAHDGIEAVRQAELLQPDVILMDVNMPGKNGIEATREIIGTSPHIGVLMLTMFDDDMSVFSAMRSGARGYLLKGAQKEEIVRAIQVVGGGEAIFSSVIARKMMFYFDAMMNKTAGNVLFPQLTEREREVLEWIARDLGNTDIARKLGLSLKTVRNHVSNILSKLQAADRTQAVIIAREAGMGGLNSLS
ncbi:Transcriptional regulatory protein DegU [Paenibacillus plantiphilus]|uniref:Transcriptional regulatory protein DegU n=1 Tax=Paenibacillus plantiphilus TaxID=2905650 RepID=A0ABM9BVC4_9BACL|nr:response regulator transcription factor [Paenibacillus plantiphilus]CAH1195600.1 Transcriptional regulatory protein DegU [Paenibacillus plantiphilus]